MSPGLLSNAQRVATEIFVNAGVETAWIDCPLSRAEFGKYPACHQAAGTTDFAVRLLNASMAAKVANSKDWLGFAQYCPEDERGCVANLFYERVLEHASQTLDETAFNNVEGRAARILGHTMAHEIGHLLLGPNAHSSKGIMRAVWSPDDLKLMSWADVAFVRAQSDKLRFSIRRRVRFELQPDVKAIMVSADQAAPRRIVVR